MVSARSLSTFLLGLSLLQGCAKADMAPAMSPGHGGMPRPPREAPASAVSVDHDGVVDGEDLKGNAGAVAPPPAPKHPMAQAPQAPGGAQSDARQEPAKETSSAQDKRSPVLIYTASFRMAVFEVNSGLAEVERLSREVGGFVVKRTDQLITIRVPAARFYESVGRIEKLGDVTQRDVVAQDVTEEYLDLEIRLRNARAIRDRFEQLLAKANSVQDSLMIERELNRVASEIDRMEGRLKYLRDRAAFSTITVNFEPRRSVAPPPSVRLPFPWLHSSDLSRLLAL